MPRLLVSTGDGRRREALAAGLPALLPEWSVRVVDGVDPAIAALGDEPFDAVVGDADVPGFEDPVLLRLVRETQPAAARIAVVASPSESEGLRLSNIAHQCIALPLVPDVVAHAVRRTWRLVDTLDDPAVRARVSRLSSLAAAPPVYADLTRALSDPDVEVDAVGAIVAKDPAVAAKVLQLVNSAFFARRAQTSRIEDAVLFLGFHRLRALVLTVESFGMFATDEPQIGGIVEGLQTHGLMVATSTAAVLAGHPEGEDGFTAGLMHDIGKLVFADQDADEWMGVLDVAGRSGRPVFEVEQERFGTTHAEVGGALLDLWGLPMPVVEAVAYHHRPDDAGHSFGLVGAVHIADALVHELSSAADRTALAKLLNQAYLEGAGLEDRLPRWSELVARRIGR